MPDFEARKSLIENKINGVASSLSSEDLNKVVELTDGYTGADLVALIKEAAMQPLREVPTEQLLLLKDISEIRSL